MDTGFFAGRGEKMKPSNNCDEGNMSDLELVEELYDFLTGECPDCIHLARGHQPKLSQKKAFAIIWYLQEHLRVLPDNIERCDNCGNLYDSHCGGLYWETKCKHYCDGCIHLVPPNYDRGKR